MFSNECCASLCRQNTLCVGGGATAKLQHTTVPVFTLMLEKITQGVGSMWLLLLLLLLLLQARRAKMKNQRSTLQDLWLCESSAQLAQVQRISTAKHAARIIK